MGYRKFKGKIGFIIIVTEDFSHYMGRHMTASSWGQLLQECVRLIDFVKKKNKDWTKLDDFNLECLMGDDPEWMSKDYFDVAMEPSFYKGKQKMTDFKEYMKKKMTNNHWRTLLHWILDWEASLLYLNPQPPMPWPAQPLFDKELFPMLPDDKYTQEDMISDFLEKTELNLPKPAKAKHNCKS